MQRLAHRLVSELSHRAEVVPIVRDCSRPTIGPFLLWALGKLLWEIVSRRSHIRVVHFGDPIMAFCSPLCALFGVPSVVTVHGLDVTYNNTLYRWFVRAALQNVDSCVCISQAARRACLERGVPGHKCVVLALGADPGASRNRTDADAKTARAELGRRLGVDFGGSIILLTVGRLVRRKGVAWFVQTVLPGLIRDEPRLRYLVIGGGPEREAVVSGAISNGIAEHVVLAGQVDDQALRLAYASADIFVMPNVPVQGDIEGFGLVALEAAMARLPVIAADLDGIRDAVQHEQNGVLVAAGHAAAFSEAVLCFVRSADARAEFGRRAAEHTSRAYSWGSMADKLLKLYDEIACRRPTVREVNHA